MEKAVSNRKDKNKNKGLTLVEVMIVLAIIGIMAGIAAPQVMSWLPNMRLKAEARDIFSAMQRAKMEAVRTNTTVTFNFTPSTGTPCTGGSYTFTNGDNFTITGDIEDGICLTSTFANPPTSGFLPTSLPAGQLGRFVLTHPEVAGNYEITQTIAGGIQMDRN